MIDIKNETLLTLPDAASLLPRVGGRHPSPSTIWRWCRKGLKGIFLEYLRIGGSIVTSKEAMQRFFTTLAEQDDSLDHCAVNLNCIDKKSRSKLKRRDAIEHANAILAKAGIRQEAVS